MRSFIKLVAVAFICFLGVAQANAQQYRACGTVPFGTPHGNVAGNAGFAPDCDPYGQRAGRNGSNGRYFIGQAMQQRREMEMRRRYEMQQRQMMSQQYQYRSQGRITRVSTSSQGTYGRGQVVGPPKRVTPAGTGQVTINAEFDGGQAYCDKYISVPTTFMYWKGSGANRTAHCE